MSPDLRGAIRVGSFRGAGSEASGATKCHPAENVETLTCRTPFVDNTHTQQGLTQLLAYALAPENQHSRQWITPLLTHLAHRRSAPTYRCTVCGGTLPACKCWGGEGPCLNEI
jgi:hypothetical protein